VSDHTHVRLSARLGIGQAGVAPIAHMAQRLASEAKARARSPLAVVSVKSIANACERILALLTAQLVLGSGLSFRLARRRASRWVAGSELGSGSDERAPVTSEIVVRQKTCSILPLVGIFA